MSTTERPIRYCIVPQCRTNALNSKGSRFFALPNITQNEKELETEQRKLWLKRIGLKESDLKGNQCVCEKHFINGKCFISNSCLLDANIILSSVLYEGKPCYIRDTTNPDWAPTIGLPGNQSYCSADQRFRRRKRFNQNRGTIVATKFYIYIVHNASLSCRRSFKQFISIDCIDE